MQRHLILILFLALSSCGPNAQERARQQQAREDSIRMATENEARLRFETKIVLSGKLQELQLLKDSLEYSLSDAKAELEVQKDKLNTIKQPQFLRTPEERESDIKAQVLVIDEMESQIQAILENIRRTGEEINAVSKELKKYN